MGWWNFVEMGFCCTIVLFLIGVVVVWWFRQHRATICLGDTDREHADAVGAMMLDQAEHENDDEKINEYFIRRALPGLARRYVEN